MPNEDFSQLPERLASVLTAPVTSLNPHVVNGDMTEWDLVWHLRENYSFVGHALDETLHPGPYSPTHWRFAMPLRDDQRRLGIVGFGVEGPDVPLSVAPSRIPDGQIAINQELSLYGEVDQNIINFYRPLIAKVARFVSANMEPVFAAIERRYPLGREGDRVSGWSQLLYSRWLARKGSQLVQTEAEALRQAGSHIPLWLARDANPHNRRDVARKMALIALSQTYV
jgi:hypothetical protein